MKRLTAVLVMTVVASALTIGGAARAPSVEDLGAPVTYVFSPVKPNPGWESCLLIFRNETKLRPLFVTGQVKGKDGKMRVAFEKVEGLGGLGDDPELAAMLGFGKTTGDFTMGLHRYSHARSDLERTACTDWLAREERPEISVHVDKLTKWQRAKNPKGEKMHSGYDLTLVGSISVGEASMPLSIPARAVFLEASAKEGAKDGVRLTSSFTFEGARLGLSGDDAGEIRVTLEVRGYTDFSDQTKELLEEGMSLPDLD